MRIPCYLEFDERTSTVVIRHSKTHCVQMVIKLESSSNATMSRVTSNCDCDNFWIGVKPADSVVFEENLFGKKALVVKSCDFELKE